jgi:hypothetical protein
LTTSCRAWFRWGRKTRPNLLHIKP